MGGFFRAITRVFKRKDPPQVQAIQQVTQTAEKAVSRRVSKPYSDDTIMTSAVGLEDEANVKKAELGGTILKKKKKYA